ncbi:MULTISPECIES: FecR family protein [unclassified Sphingobacterium]|uniref:FecR family protein n=1 Tax=unclassified Sphingobacterium TaxID=2609468 RepID=UPI0025ED9055|nr:MULTISPECIES: FecR family protein [unclassified Sphingobacterium]
MKITTDLINRYLTNKCTAEEAEYLENYIQYLGTSLDQLLPREEWEETKGDLEYSGEEEIRAKILAAIARKRKISFRRRMLVKLSGVAALLVFFFGIYLFLNRSEESFPADRKDLATLTADSTEVSNLYYINSGNENMSLTASDGSVITLYPKSEIKYAENFRHLKERVLYLKGKARFEVAKDKSKPFRVHSNGVTTTALGTIFIIDELRSTQTNIKLLEGKIEVKAEDVKNSRKLIRTYEPNEEITLDHKDLKVLEEVKATGKGRGGYFVQNRENIRFQNIALKDVLDLLVQNYNIKLQYDQDKIRDKYYSGVYVNSSHVYKEIIKELNYLHHADINYTNLQH